MDPSLMTKIPPVRKDPRFGQIAIQSKRVTPFAEQQSVTKQPFWDILFLADFIRRLNLIYSFDLLKINLSER